MTMKHSELIRRKLKSFGPGIQGLIGAVIMVFASQAFSADQQASGEAYGVYVNSGSVEQQRTPLAVFDPQAGVVEAEQDAVSVSDLVSANTLDSSASGALAENAVSTQTHSTLQDVEILGGVVKADLVVAMTRSTANGTKAVSDAGGSTFAGLVVNGVSMADQIEPNTVITVPGVGDVVLNEQTRHGDGSNDSGLEVNMIHVLLKNALTGEITGEIVVGSAASESRFMQ